MSAKQKPAAKAPPRAPSDEEMFVGHYLAVMRKDAPAEIARLAALMAREGGKFDPAKYVVQAIALRQEAEAAVISHRIALQAEVTILHLHGLHYELGRLGDAEAGKHLELIGKRLKDLEDERARHAEELLYGIMNVPSAYEARREFVADLERTTGQQSPKSPSGIRHVLPWSVHGLPRAEFPILEKALTDYLCIFLCKPHNSRDFDLTHNAPGLIERLRSNLGRRSLSPVQKERLRHAMDYQQEIIERAEFPKKWTPGQDIPKPLQKAVASYYLLHWESIPFNDTEHLSRMALLVAEFRPFWKAHSFHYQQWGEEQAAQQRKAKNSKSYAGKKSRQWQVFLDAFRRWRAGRKVTIALINEFPQQKDVPRDDGRKYLKRILEKEPERFHSD